MPPGGHGVGAVEMSKCSQRSSPLSLELLLSFALRCVL